ncbi:protein STICHEL-like isoform X2 [Durio zibethinus]|uniref:Protein STICHEL-like isoform X2 n=1 Tax=Durio zibethinus TaxID=66656 RepID=A0A6P5WYW5_DURZI|nr:protein STICHEL-like isoform X2 [Durio zibethinus]
MSDVRISDPSRLHLKKELTQIRKAARVLRDPGTTSSWKSPLSSSRSVAAAVAAAAAGNNFDNESLNRPNGNAYLDLSQLPVRVESSVRGHINNANNNSNGNGNEKEKRVFLYNWKGQQSSSINMDEDEDDDDDDGDRSSSWIQDSVDDNSLSDARNGVDSKSDTYLGESCSASMIFRCRDANPVSSATPSTKRILGASKKSKKNCAHNDVFCPYEQKKSAVNRNSVNSRKLLRARPALALGLGRDDSVDQSDDTEDYSNSEDFRKISGASPLLLKPKRKNWSHSSSRLLKTGRKEDSSYCYSTPALSTSSYNKYFNHNPSTVGSWDATTTSFNDMNEEVGDPLDLPGQQGCGIPCYWTKRTPKHRGVCGSCYSPSLSDTLRKGSSILCGSQLVYHRHRRSSSLPNKQKIALRSAQCLPLLSNSGDGRGGSSIGTRYSDDELSTNFGELDLEALSRLDGRRWSSSCRSLDGLEIVALTGEGEEEGTPENIKSLSQKYKPIFFNELIGQNIVVQSLMNAVSRGRIAPFYLFQGPRGTGKTSTARIFAAALNCMATEDAKPCGYCTECTEFISGKSRELWEVDSTNKKGIDRVRYVLRNMSTGLPPNSSRYKVFVFDECHLLPSKIWLALLKFLEDPPPRVVFIFITTDLDNVPRTVQSRCQKYLFNKIKDSDIMARLRKISTDENLEVESDALDLIALNADGSLRDAETMLDQLSLLGKRITTSLVNELVGVVSDVKLLELLELAMSSDTAETVKRARELMDSGVDPMVLMSQLASLIMDIIAGTYNIADSKYCHSFFGGRALTEAELERLKDALKLLSEAEKQLRVSTERSTWFTAILLQLGSWPSPDLTQSSSSWRQSSKTTEDDPSSTSREAIAYKQKSGTQFMPWKSTSSASLHKSVNGNPNHQGELVSRIDGYGSSSGPSHGRIMDGGALPAACDNNLSGNMILACRNLEKLDDIWAKCIDKCHSKTLRQLLHDHGKLLSLAEDEGVLIAYLTFADRDIKSRAERFLSSITNSIEIVMRCSVEVRLILLTDGEVSLDHAHPAEMPESLQQAETAVEIEDGKAISKNVLEGFSGLDLNPESLKLSKGSFSDLEGKLRGVQDYSNCSARSIVRIPELLAEGTADIGSSKEGSQEIPMQRIESIIREQRLETAWLQAVAKGTPGSLDRLKPEKNQVLPQEVYRQNNLGSMNLSAFSSHQWDDELNRELKILRTNDGQVIQKDQIGRRADHYPMSPSLLHNSSLSKENLGYESGSGTGGCSGLFCWNNSKPHRRAKVKGTPVGSRRTGRFLLFGECGKSKKTENRCRSQAM